MSYPKNLGQRIQYITNYSTNSVKLNPDNSATSLTGITSGSKLQFTLPPNSLVDLSSFSVYADFSTTKAAGGFADDGVAARPHYLTRNANNLIQRLTVEIGGQVISDISDYNRIQQIFSDMQFGIEGSSKKLLSNSDPLDKQDLNGMSVGGLRCLTNDSDDATENPNLLLITDKRPICLTQFIGFLGGGAGVKYIDTQLTGAVKITFDLAPASHVLFRAEGSTTEDGLPYQAVAVPNGPAANYSPQNLAFVNVADADCRSPSYSIANVYATIKKCQIDDGVYFASLSTALQAGIPFEYKYSGFHQTKGSDCNGGTTMRYEIMANSVDLALMTFYSSTGHLVDGIVNAAGLAGNANDIYKEQWTSLNAKTLSTLGKESSFTTNYFQRKGDAIDKTVFFVNGERIPQYDMKNPQVYNQSLIDFGINDDVSSGIYYGINSYKSWEKNYWTATARLSHICNDDSFISGFNANGVPMTLSVETTAKPGVGAGNVLTPQLFIMTSEVMQVYAGRQINRVR